MGMALGTANDLETRAKLNRAFNTAQLTKLRNHHEGSGHLFDHNRRLSRLAYRLEAYPSAVPRKWMGLLNSLSQAAAHKILDALQSALDTPSVTSVTFHYQSTGGGSYDANVTLVAPTYTITLLCPSDWNGADGTFPPQADAGEGLPVDLGPNGP
jgi:hypothetical protein